ncbi:hypothetical protein GCM10009730_51650 [Streptomyces albidochromogenes]
MPHTDLGATGSSAGAAIAGITPAVTARTATVAVNRRLARTRARLEDMPMTDEYIFPPGKTTPADPNGPRTYVTSGPQPPGHMRTRNHTVAARQLLLLYTRPATFC